MNITNYLEQFGYLTSASTKWTSTSHAEADSGLQLESNETSDSLIRFQEFYNFPADGTLNQSTLALISKSRCGVKDNPTAYRVHNKKWTKTTLK
jgi:hypothetical protein